MALARAPRASSDVDAPESRVVDDDAIDGLRIRDWLVYSAPGVLELTLVVAVRAVPTARDWSTLQGVLVAVQHRARHIG